jgi:riboflavin kinase/FMN adenylyltransferase
MRVIETLSDVDVVETGCVLTIGNFDGVHLGHQKILAAAKQAAKDKASELVAMTFEPHPFAVLHPEKAPGVLTPLELKKHLLESFGVDCLIVLKDEQELLSLTAAEFVDRFLVQNIRPGVVVEGEDFNFGRGRSGNVRTLNSLGQQKGFDVTIVQACRAKLSIGPSVRVSSTIIRNLLEAGKISDAAVALGKPYRLIGPIIAGRGKGKRLGFPTANLKATHQIIPAEAVYAGTVETADNVSQLLQKQENIPAVFSIGRTATYGPGQPLLVEAHLLADNVGDLIGKFMAMDFIRLIREQKKFDSEKELSAQIEKDCKNAKKILE